MKQFKYLIEECHREEWQPLWLQGSNNKVQRRVFITDDEAEIMNVNSSITHLRYVKAEKIDVKAIEVIAEEVKVEEVVVDEKAQAVADYVEEFGKKPFHGWDSETLREKINANKA